MKNKKGFTLVELLVSITIMAVLSGIILFGVTQYINKSKDSNIYANLAILIPAGEVYYNAENASAGDGYHGFCASSVVSNAKNQIPINSIGNTGCTNAGTAGLCCAEDSSNNYQSWAACVREFTNSAKAYCVDSRGVKKDIDNSACLLISTWTSPIKCP
jgi:prepilin-type N-terminal cleavage/methylation domain-containing protein